MKKKSYLKKIFLKKKLSETPAEAYMENNKQNLDKKDKTPKRQIDLLLHNKYKKEKKLESAN